jgi:chitinase domain-containing protein 1
VILPLTGWVSDVRRAGSGVKIVPRVLLEGWTMADFQEVFASESNMARVAEFAVQNLQKHKFDGMVLEVWSQLGGRFNRCLFLHNHSRFLNQMPI